MDRVRELKSQVEVDQQVFNALQKMGFWARIGFAFAPLLKKLGLRRGLQRG